MDNRSKPKKITVYTDSILYTDPGLYYVEINEKGTRINIYEIRKLMKLYFNDKDVIIKFPHEEEIIPCYYLYDYQCEDSTGTYNMVANKVLDSITNVGYTNSEIE